jgi:hypothetical protein
MSRARVMYFLAVTATAVVVACSAHAQQTSFGHIVSLQTGSLGGPPHNAISTGIEADDTMAVSLDAPFVNASETGPVTVRPLPAIPCKITNGGYALDPKDTGTKVNESVLLSAYLAGHKVSLHLNGCAFNKPRIISVVLSTANN